MHNIWVSRTSTTILILKCQIVLAGENRVDDGQFWIPRGFLKYWEILGYVKQADWASFHLLFLIIFTLSEFPCCAKSCPGASLLPRSNLFAWGNRGRVILTRKWRGHMLHANERATAQSRQIFFPLCPRHFCCCLTGFPGDLDQHFHNRVSKAWLPQPAIQGQQGKRVRDTDQNFGGEGQGALVAQSLSPTEPWAHLEPGWPERLAWGKAGPRPPAWPASLETCCSQVLTLENWLLCTGSNFSMLFNTCYCIHIVKGPHPVLIQDLDTESLWCYKHHF